ncbi:YwmB family TATA-box binding protein [Oceanobacillus damuensis]|uniref:YwmB family TATA-box binding protein n=1 Tax=Oceanobacillus damuensis TaxID=937928 RepID=UPI000833676E|nr:YwmB family TATA-box binding protein [Oceanobacillus damuensis]
MRKTAILLIMMVFITAKPMAYGMERDEMVDLANFTLKNSVPIESWQVTLKENLTRKKAEETVNNLKDSSLVTVSEDENVIKYQVRDVHKQVGLDVSYSVVIPKNEAFKPEMNAVIEGTQWNDEIEEEYLSIKRSMEKKIFTKSLKLFACLTTEPGGIIDSDVFVKRITKYFNVEHFATQTDTIENSMHEKIIYGYTDLWKQDFIIQGTQMNLQIAVVQVDETNVKYTVGTPILIHEY